MVGSSARLHDVGKIVISDAILNKRGLLTGDEFERIKIHPVEGERIIKQFVSRTGEMEFLRHANLFAG
jgi:putative two-component system response regulator